MARKEDVEGLQEENRKLKVLLGFLGPEDDFDLDEELSFVQGDKYRPSDVMKDHVAGRVAKQEGEKSSGADDKSSEAEDDSTGDTNVDEKKDDSKPDPVTAGRGYRQSLLGTQGKGSNGKKDIEISKIDISTPEGRAQQKEAWASLTNQGS